MTIEVFCDGGSRGNPGPAAFGFVVKGDSRVIKRDQGYIGIATNNFAEYTALVRALVWLGKNFPGQDVKIYLDSKLVVSQLRGLYKVKSAHIRDFILKIRGLETSLGRIFYYHIGREQNREADRLVNIALDRHTNGA